MSYQNGTIFINFIPYYLTKYTVKSQTLTTSPESLNRNIQCEMTRSRLQLAPTGIFDSICSANDLLLVVLVVLVDVICAVLTLALKSTVQVALANAV